MKIYLVYQVSDMWEPAEDQEYFTKQEDAIEFVKDNFPEYPVQKQDGEYIKFFENNRCGYPFVGISTEEVKESYER